MAHAQDAALNEFRFLERNDFTSFQLPVLSRDPSIASSKTSLNDAHGRTSLVHFFATWCEVCRLELPALERLKQRSNGEIAIFIISVDEPEPRIRRFLDTHPIGLPISLDADGALSKQWGVVSLPTSFVLDADLKPRFVAEKDQDWDKIDTKALRVLLAGEGSGRTHQMPEDKPAERTESNDH